MGLLDRLRPRRSGRRATAVDGAPAGDGDAVRHLLGFAASRRGVEAYVEPATAVTPTTVVLVAVDGEWTRRRVRDPRQAQDVARRAGVPVYDVQLTGYPQRMRAWTAQRAAQERGAAEERGAG